MSDQSQAERDHTPRPWPENSLPTATQLADWLVIASREERERCVAGLMGSAEVANRCLIRDHDGLESEVKYAWARASRYHSAWLSARRRIHPQNFLRDWREFSEQMEPERGGLTTPSERESTR